MKAPAGYTIVEVLIFIAVSSLMFVSAIGVINGRQQGVQFSQTVRELDLRIQDVMNDVSTGYFPSDENAICTTSGGGQPQFSVGSGGLGSSNRCVYIGKVIQFRPTGVSEAESKYTIFNVVGRRYTTDNPNDLTPVSTVGEAKPTTAFSNVLSEDGYLPFGIKIKKVLSTGTASESFNTSLLALVSNLEGSAAGSTTSDGQSVKVGAMQTGTSTYVDTATAVSVISSMKENALPVKGYTLFGSRDGVVVCLEDDGGRQASITVGGRSGARTLLEIGDPRSECA